MFKPDIAVPRAPELPHTHTINYLLMEILTNSKKVSLLDHH